MSRFNVRHPIEVHFLGPPEDRAAAISAANSVLVVEGLPALHVDRQGDIWLSIDPVDVTGWEFEADREPAYCRAVERVSAILADLPFALAPHDLPATRSVTLPLYVALNAGCNLKCWYCTEYGENRSFTRQLPPDRLMELLRIAYEAGHRTFRFTGGEPTLYRHVADVLRQTQQFGDDVRIAITTNGKRLDRIGPVLPELAEPKVFLSVDGVARGVERGDGDPGFKIEKWLTPVLMEAIETVRSHASVRFNYVLTRSSAQHLRPLIDYSMEEGIDVKIFELLLRDFFFAHGRPRTAVFHQQYIPVRDVIVDLVREFGEPEHFAGLGGRGIPMHAINTGANRVIFFDSLTGSHYSARTCHSCMHFPCQEGLYAPLLNASGTLHPAGCQNRVLHYPMADTDPPTSTQGFHRMRNEIQRSRLERAVPEELEEHLHVA